ncbi:MAG TPA: redoxin domain-containing protein [Mucilaginibacter sp.]|nr:redoxin domain-containing protein [Mucilaginibacter sp.]
MKNFKSLMVLPVLLASQCVFAQNTDHLKLSDPTPSAGAKVILTYDPAGTVTDGKKDITASVYYLDNKNYPVDDIDLKPDGKLLKGAITINPVAKAFFIRISSGGDIDNNNDKGYVYMVYKDKQPVEGAYASEGSIYSGGAGVYFAKIKPDVGRAAELYKKEFALNPKSKKDYEAGYYYMIARVPEYKADVSEKINSLEKSDKEDDLILASGLLRMSKNTKAMDSLNTVIRTKFPDGLFVKNEMGSVFFKEKDVAKRDSIYHVYIKRYPENAADKNSIQDNFRLELASHYLYNRDMDNFHKYLVQVKNKSGLAGYYNNDAYDWAKKGDHLDEAEQLSKQSLDMVSEKIKNPSGQAYNSPKQMKKNYEFTYDMYADTYAFILFKEGKYHEALQYEQPVIDHTDKTIDPDVADNYIQILIANAQTAKAKDFAETQVKAGHGSVAMKEVLKKEYVKSKGSDNDFDQYIASLESASKSKLREELAKTMINQPAPAFALKDLDGKTVSLADLKGKVVIVDFWATWCGPCKASFPGMQLAVNKYKDDANVKFLFVDTWENGDSYVDGVKKFIADNKYTFHVLVDEKNSEGKQAKVVSSYKVDGIPTKFIIDKNGNIRFKYIGYSGTPEKLVDEVTDMIEMTDNPDSVAAVSGAGNSKSK